MEIRIKMSDELLRHELPVQSIRERGQECTATVPVHLRILNLPVEVRTSPSAIAEAEAEVRRWYNEDMTYYLAVLREADMDLPWLEDYKEFGADWSLGGDRVDNGFLRLFWQANGETNYIGFVAPPVVLNNQHNERGEFYSPEDMIEKRWIEIIYRGLRDSERVYMAPEKMLKYGTRSQITRFDPECGVAEVVANAFCSDYHKNMAKALLLRDFAVFYLNNLLHMAENSHNN